MVVAVVVDRGAKLSFLRQSPFALPYSLLRHLPPIAQICSFVYTTNMKHCNTQTL